MSRHPEALLPPVLVNATAAIAGSPATLTCNIFGGQLYGLYR
jgi:hypothetical protein